MDTILPLAVSCIVGFAVGYFVIGPVLIALFLR